MRAWAPVLALSCVVLASAPAAGQDAEALRKEIEALQNQLRSLSERLQKLEAAPPPPAPPAAPPAAAAPPPAPPGVSALDLARPRQPSSPYHQRGAGQLLFALGVT